MERTDTERIDWLERNQECVHPVYCHTVYPSTASEPGPSTVETRFEGWSVGASGEVQQTWRAAVDLAMDTEEE